MELCNKSLKVFALVLAAAALLMSAPARAWGDADSAVSFDDPKGWNAVEPKPGSLAAYVSPRVPGRRAVISLTSVKLEDVDGDGSLDDDVFRYTEEVSGRFDHFKKIGEADVRVGGHSAHRLTFRAQKDKHHMQVTSVMVIDGLKAYMFIYSSNPKTYNDHIADFNKMLDTVRIMPSR